MNKKAVIKKACSGKGGPGPAAFRAMQQNDSRKINLIGYKAPTPFQMIGSGLKSMANKVSSTVKSGVKGYQDFSAREKKLNDAASSAIGNVSSNDANMNKMREIKNKLRKSGNY